MKGFDKSVREIKQTAARIAWYMRGGVTMTELLAMSQSDWQFFGQVIEDNIDLSKKSQQIII